jgi:hypothetical protein
MPEHMRCQAVALASLDRLRHLHQAACRPGVHCYNPTATACCRAALHVHCLPATELYSASGQHSRGEVRSAISLHKCTPMTPTNAHCSCAAAARTLAASLPRSALAAAASRAARRCCSSCASVSTASCTAMELHSHHWDYHWHGLLPAAAKCISLAVDAPAVISEFSAMHACCLAEEHNSNEEGSSHDNSLLSVLPHIIAHFNNSSRVADGSLLVNYLCILWHDVMWRHSSSLCTARVLPCCRCRPGNRRHGPGRCRWVVRHVELSEHLCFCAQPHLAPPSSALGAGAQVHTDVTPPWQKLLPTTMRHWQLGCRRRSTTHMSTGSHREVTKG